jgi:hypothetical protein
VEATRKKKGALTAGGIRLDKIAGEVCAAVPVILHRPNPSDATIKQVALTIRGERFYAVFMLGLAGPPRQFPAYEWNS